MIGPDLLLPLEHADRGGEGIDLPTGILDRGGRSRLTDCHAGTGRVEQAHRLVGQLAAREIPPRQLHAVHHGLVEDRHGMMLLERVHHASHHADRHLVIRLFDLHHLEAAGEGRILFKIFLVFSPGRGRDRPQLPAGQGRLEHVGRIPLAGLAAGPDQRVGLVDEKNDRHRALLDLIDDVLEPILKLPLHAGARLEQAQVERSQRDVFQGFRHIAGGDPIGKPFNNGRLADAGLTGEDRVVLPTTRQDIDDLPHLGLPAEHRVDLARLRAGCQIDRELIEGRRLRRTGRAAIGSRRRGLWPAALPAAVGELRFDRSRKDPARLTGQHIGGDLPQLVAYRQGPRGDRFFGEQCLQQPRPPHVHLAVVHARDQPGLADQHADLRRQQRRPGVACLEAIDGLRQAGHHLGLIDAEMPKEQTDVVARLLEQFHQPVLDLHIVVGLGKAQPRRRLEGSLARRIELADQSAKIEAGHGERSW